ncbi:MAG: hypothetical protein MZW92_53840 [Comamonadaceae bacterium]|nr:hypothetical protein [Comamonadaceae bacterium]
MLAGGRRRSAPVERGGRRAGDGRVHVSVHGVGRRSCADLEEAIQSGLADDHHLRGRPARGRSASGSTGRSPSATRRRQRRSTTRSPALPVEPQRRRAARRLAGVRGQGRRRERFALSFDRLPLFSTGEPRAQRGALRAGARAHAAARAPVLLLALGAVTRPAASPRFTFIP